MKKFYETALDLFQDDPSMTYKNLPLMRNLERFQGPSYVYYRDMIDNRLSTFKDGLNDIIKIHYAIKANPNPHIVEHLARHADGFDLASGFELDLALNTGVHPSRISIAGPAKSLSELRSAASVGATVNIESQRELDIIGQLSEEMGFSCPVALRINVPFETKGFGLKMGGSPRQFGIDWDQVPAMIDRLTSYQLDFQGLHLFSGSQNLDTEQISIVQEKSYDLARKLADDFQLTMKKINLGGGLGIPYYPNDRALDSTEIKLGLNRIAEQAARDFDNVTLALELGRYLVGEAGIYVCEVIDIKRSGGVNYAITNGGLHHHLLATGNFGQVIRRSFPIKVLGKTGVEDSYRITGCLCTPLDIFASDIKLPRLEVGDKILVFQSGAYGKSSSPSGFLSHPDAKETLI
ncbi:pyridoxal-dependent decarboxylase, exosortase A system-associated [Pseudobacteriovorax antillogorgiicola]|uniref:Diaminopimelate decarboxylase n=1 Tax=Pseudobacteriovorax antillogorgiicola TaxID=1513793 RepID=A0A1Y6BZG6_9BACT|nr:pyridoxal-dependent decarboxylase, exosortase A system-associated [Pseudobacteriovorax antillogorgiicola]TCS51190.1 diaminopimelate decarboxylase [Pseudobacteriovorax antillogorgiicola]SMF37593.1 diaminopimelate decarboxylase [Pseudobacteriovorax antillogorgiicola]